MGLDKACALSDKHVLIFIRAEHATLPLDQKGTAGDCTSPTVPFPSGESQAGFCLQPGVSQPDWGVEGGRAGGLL